MSYASNALVRRAGAAVSNNKSRTEKLQAVKRNGAGIEKRRRHCHRHCHRHGVVCSSAEGAEGGVMRVEEGRTLKVPERLKVVALVAFAMCLCNADRVVMSVAVVPLAARYGWSSSFLGIVQVRTDVFVNHISL